MPPNLNKDRKKEIPSTFAGIWKYPTGRDIPFRSGQDWLKGKKVDDDIGGKLWRVHDKLYDLSAFVTKHPGGPEWLELTQGTDITEAFETSHVVNVSFVESILAKYFVANAKHPRVSPYTFKEDGFYKTLKRKIEPIAKKVGTGPTRKMYLMQDSLVLITFTLAISGTYLDSLLLKLLAGTFLAWTLIGAHNFFHLKSNWRKYYYAIGLLSSYEWQITHALSHHLYPNTLMDYELSLFPTYEFLPNRSKNIVQKYGPVIYSHLLYFIGFWGGFVVRISQAVKGTYKWRAENGIVIAELGLLFLIAPTVQVGFWSWILIQSMSSFVFLSIGATAAHHHPEIFHDGDEARPDPDFGLCQLDATRERAGDLHKNDWVILVTFGNHCLHHLFPTICHSKLPYLRASFEETLKEFSEQFPPFYQWELYLGAFQQLARTKANKFPISRNKKD